MATRSKPLPCNDYYGDNDNVPKFWSKAIRNVRKQAKRFGHKISPNQYFIHRNKIYKDVSMKEECFSVQCQRCNRYLRFTLFSGPIEYYSVGPLSPCRYLWMMR